jgi:hypothetical protein
MLQKICIVPESKTTSPWLDSKGPAAYDASTLDGSEVRAGCCGNHDPLSRVRLAANRSTDTIAKRYIALKLL